MTASIVTERRGALLLRVRASPGASRRGILGVHGEAIKVAVREPPERGRANAAVREVLAEALGLRPAQIEIESGEASRDKSFRIDGISRADLEERLRMVLGGKGEEELR